MIFLRRTVNITLRFPTRILDTTSEAVSAGRSSVTDERYRFHGLWNCTGQRRRAVSAGEQSLPNPLLPAEKRFVSFAV